MTETQTDKKRRPSITITMSLRQATALLILLETALTSEEFRRTDFDFKSRVRLIDRAEVIRTKIHEAIAMTKKEKSND